MIYSQNSRYYNSDLEYDLPQSSLIKDHYDYDTITVLAEEASRLDLISLRVYNTPVYWWIIARENSILNPASVPVGTVLRIPKLNI